MKKVGKRMLTFLLALAMMITYMPAMAFAEAGEENSSENNSAAAVQEDAAEAEISDEDAEEEASEKAHEEAAEVSQTEEGSSEAEAAEPAEEEQVQESGGSPSVTAKDGDDEEEGEDEDITIKLEVSKTDLLVNQQIPFEVTSTGNVDHVTVFFAYEEGAENNEDEQWRFYQRLGRSQ